VDGALSLFIDEQGRVQRVRADEPKLPEAFERPSRCLQGRELFTGTAGAHRPRLSRKAARCEGGR
jgi:hypothetical protein